MALNNLNDSFETPTANLDYSSTVPLVGVDMNAPMDGWGDISETTPVWSNGNDSYDDPQDGPRDTIPVYPPADGGWAETEDHRHADATADSYNVTLPRNYRSETSALQPVTGWLVCIEGADKGKDYRLHAEINYIGRSRSNDVVLGSDPTVSRDRHALLAYDPKARMFFFAPSGGSSIVRQNGRPVLSTVELKAGDRLEIGEGIYMFVPLCGENFQW